jgi:hypothetical protein
MTSKSEGPTVKFSLLSLVDVYQGTPEPVSKAVLRRAAVKSEMELSYQPEVKK